MEINDVFGANNQTQLTDALTSNEKVMGKDDFLKLLVTQLKYQDPLEPQSPEDYSAQLAQFSSLEQLAQMNSLLESSLETNLLLATSVNNTLAANVIGKQVKAIGSETYFDGSNPAPIVYEIPRDAQNVQIEITDASGKTVRTIDINNIDAGEHTYEWNGKDKEGNYLEAGNYQIKIKATSYDGIEMNANTYMTGIVTGLRYGANGPTLMIGNTEVPLANVLELLLPDFNPGNTGGGGNGTGGVDPNEEDQLNRINQFLGRTLL
jgi:flagellar basal-body rod modification protein FlgD